MAGLLAMAVIGAVSLFGNGVDGLWDRTASSLSAPLTASADGT